MTYRASTRWTEQECSQEVLKQFRRWNHDDPDVIGDKYDFPVPEEVGGAAASLRFYLRGQSMTVSCASQPTYSQNLRCVAFAVEAMRMNEKRGIADTLAKAYLQLEAPQEERDPYEVLGVRPDAESFVIESAFRTLAKRYHPDTGGEHADAAKMTEVNEAFAKVKS